MLKFNNPNLARRLAKIASAVGMAETRIAIARDDLKLYAAHVPAVAEALQYLEPAANLLEPLFDELHKIIHDPACAGITLSDGAEGQQPPESSQGPSTSGQQPAADTQSANEHKPGSAVSLSTLFGIALPGLNIGNRSAAEQMLAQLLNAADEPQPQPQPDSESEFDSECPVVAQVAALTEQVTTLQDDVKTLVEICQSQQNQLKLLKEAVFADANFFTRKVANGN